MLYQLVYVSSTVGLLTKDQLLVLLEQARLKNARLGITGVLLYRDGNVLQVLEGKEEEVKRLFATISGDLRHSGIIVLTQGRITARDFGVWEMAFRDLDSPEIRQIPGYSEFLNTPLNAETGITRSRRLLSLFKAQR
ncbi:MAG TPA: BLUF domain-containing protein [Candidatus Synoicihabitans sp.]|nr:BLUF domain-containing protein [Candidatus Synoicihabitans sp.]